MSKFPWRSLFWLAIIGGAVYVAWIPNPEDAPASGGAPLTPAARAASLSALIADLNSDDEAVQQRAFRELVGLGAEAISELEAAAGQARRYHRRMMISVLEQLFLSSEFAVADEAEAALERLARHPERHIANDGSRVLLDNANFRHARAFALVTSRNGRLLDANMPGLDPELRADFLRIFQRSKARAVFVPGDWTGGDEGLRFIRRLYPNELLLVFLAPDAPVSPQGVYELTLGRKSLRVRHPQCPCLGVTLEDTTQAGGAVVVYISPRGPAARAGVAVRDVLTTVNGLALTSRDDIDRALWPLRPGDVVELQIERKSKVQKFSIPLGSDYRTLGCDCFDQLKPLPATDEQTVLTPTPLTPIPLTPIPRYAE